ncbi:MAG: glycosyltransferase family 2 protein [Candidatus Methylacidiphilales bacterium]
MKCSVVIPSLNQGRYLAEALESVLAQAGPNFGVEVEIFLADAGSSDETLKVIDRYASHLAWWRSHPDEGQTAAINEGLQRATGEVMCYLCADDYFEPGALARVAEAFESDRSVDMVYGDGFFLEGDSGWKRVKRAGDFSVERLKQHNFLIQPAVFWRRGVYEQYGALDARLRYCMDHEYWLRVSGGTRWRYIPEPLATCRLHPDAKTSAALVAAWEETACMTEVYGLGKAFEHKARWMRCGGARWYHMKRRLLCRWGKFRAKLHL